VEKHGFRRGGRAAILGLSLVAIMLINATMAFFISQRISERIIQREAQVAQDFISRMFQAKRPDGALFDPPQPGAALAAFARELSDLPDLLRANVYSPDRFIRYSTQKGLIGIKFDEANDELDEAFAGETIAKLATITRESKGEQLALPLKAGESFIEAYFPLAGADGKPIAVVELYRRPTGVDAVIANLQGFIWLSAGLSGAVLFAALCLVLAWRPGRRTA
jgi:two-component system sensor histidine kinase HydH